MDGTIDLPNTLRCKAKDIGCTYYVIDTGFDPYYKDRLKKHDRECPFVKLAPLLKAQNKRLEALEEAYHVLEQQAELLECKNEGISSEEDIAGRYIMMELSIHGVGSTYTLEIDQNLEGGRFRYDHIKSPDPLDNFRVIDNVLHFNAEESGFRYSGEFSTCQDGLIVGTYINVGGVTDPRRRRRKGRWIAIKFTS